MEREYFDAKFEGLEKLMRVEKENTVQYIGAVSKNATKALDALASHEKDPDAHSAGIVSRGKGEWLSTILVLVSVGALVVDIWSRHH